MVEEYSEYIITTHSLLVKVYFKNVIKECISQATKAALEMDAILLELFHSAIEETATEATEESIAGVHNFLIQKIYNARCNEYLRTIGKLSCIDRRKAVDVNVGLRLRDQLKTYAAEKRSIHNK